MEVIEGGGVPDAAVEVLEHRYRIGQTAAASVNRTPIRNVTARDGFGRHR